MRLNINLATQPYEVARQYRQRMTMLIGILGLIAVVLVSYIVVQRVKTRPINRQLSEEQGQIDGLDREESQARTTLNKPVNRAIADQSDFLNELFARKSLSWTRIFMEMERIVPGNLHVVSMKPEYTKTNDLVIHIVVATDSRDRAVELVRRMEKSTHFRQPQVVAEMVVTNTTDQAAGGGNIQFDIAAIYVPVAGDDDAVEPDKGAADATPNKAADTAAAPAKAPTPSPTPAAAKSPASPPNANAAQNRLLRANAGKER